MRLLAVVIAALIVLAGCSSGSSASRTPTSTRTPTPTRTATPTEAPTASDGLASVHQAIENETDCGNLMDMLATYEESMNEALEQDPLGDKYKAASAYYFHTVDRLYDLDCP